MTDRSDREQLEKELAYYKRRVDELAGENLKHDYTISGLRHESKQKRQGFALLSELHQTLAAEKHVSTILKTTIEAINSALGMDRTVALLPTEAEHSYRPAHLLGFREEQAAELSERTFVLPEDFAAGTGLLLVHRATTPTPLIDEIRGAFELPYFICVPVMGDGAPIGLLLSGRLKEARPLYPPLDRGDVDTFQAIAGFISASVRNMRVAVLEELDRVKTEFFANISHEFRTPIALTIGPLDQLLNGRYGVLPDLACEQLRVMRRNQERLIGLVNQILDLAKLEAGEMELHAAQIPDVNRFVADRIEPFRAMAEQRGVELRIALDPAVAEADIYLDLEKFDKVLHNLVSNALKFTHEGFIEVVTAVREHTFWLTVADTGVGIKEDEIPHVFDRFRQADGSVSREYAGTGIGLALVQEVVKLHGGTVSVLSQYGRGTSFRVTIPLGRTHLEPTAIAEHPPEPVGEPWETPTGVVVEGATDRIGVGRLNAEAEAAFDASRRTVLYAEDNPDLRTHVRDLLADAFNVFLAVDGRDGLEAARRYRPDLLITDQMMPGMSGHDLLRAVRADPALRGTPVVFLTARVGSDARIESLDAGADDYLTKPFHEGELLARVRNLIRGREQQRRLTELTHRLEARVEEQLGELVRSGKLRQFLPPALAEYLARDTDVAHSVERRKVTVLCVMIGGLARATEALEPEELSTVVSDYLRELTSVAVARGGTVETSGVTGLLVLFGAPDRLEPELQAVAAAAAALTMKARMDELAAGWRRRGIVESLSFRAAINTGYCTVGVYGSELYHSYTAVGVPMMAATLLTHDAPDGQVLITAATHTLLEGRVVAEERGAVTLAPLSRELRVFALRDLSDEGPATDAGDGAATFLPK